MNLDYEVLIPAYAAQDVVGAAVRSALAQTPAPSAVRVCVDGLLGPDDRTAVEARSQGATEVIVLSENSGVGAARHKLLASARAEFVVFLDCDDVLATYAAKAWAAGFEHRPEASVIAYSWVSMQDGPSLPEAASRVAEPVGLQSVPPHTLWRRNPITSSAAMARRTHLQAAGGYNPNARRLVDYEMWLKMASQGRRLYVGEEPIVARRVNSGTITGDVRRAVRREIELVTEHVPAHVGRRAHRRRVMMAWLRGFSRHLDYGNPPHTYLSARQLAHEGIEVCASLDVIRRPGVAAAWTRLRAVLGALR